MTKEERELLDIQNKIQITENEIGSVNDKLKILANNVNDQLKTPQNNYRPPWATSGPNYMYQTTSRQYGA